jgi:undecaprenyl-diphosphatase
MNLIHVIILAIVEGLTEFLPVSSTGHMIIASTFMGIASDPFVKMFTVAIQFGAILSVVVLYYKRFLKDFKFYLRLLVAFIPAVICGLLFKDMIDALLENIAVVAISLILGGILFLFIDQYFAANEGRNLEVDDIQYGKGFIIGCFQVLAMVPGVSRSAATIIGGLTQGLNRTVAAEFSFFLAVPTMFAATAKTFYDYLGKEGGQFTSDQISLLAIGNVVAFVVAWIAIKGFIGFLSKNGFKIFGYYRIIVGLILLALWSFGYFDTIKMSNF